MDKYIVHNFNFRDESLLSTSMAIENEAWFSIWQLTWKRFLGPTWLLGLDPLAEESI